MALIYDAQNRTPGVDAVGTISTVVCNVTGCNVTGCNVTAALHILSESITRCFALEVTFNAS